VALLVGAALPPGQGWDNRRPQKKPRQAGLRVERKQITKKVNPVESERGFEPRPHYTKWCLPKLRYGPVEAKLSQAPGAFHFSQWRRRFSCCRILVVSRIPPQGRHSPRGRSGCPAAATGQGLRPARRQLAVTPPGTGGHGHGFALPLAWPTLQGTALPSISGTSTNRHGQAAHRARRDPLQR